MGDDEDRKRLKDNAGLENIRKDVPRADRAPPGHVGTGPTLSSPELGGMSQSRRPFQSRWHAPERQEKSPERGPPIVSPSQGGEERRFKRNDDAREKNRHEQGRGSNRRQDDDRKKEFRCFDKGDLRRDFDRSR